MLEKFFPHEKIQIWKVKKKYKNEKKKKKNWFFTLGILNYFGFSNKNNLKCSKCTKVLTSRSITFWDTVHVLGSEFSASIYKISWKKLKKWGFSNDCVRKIRLATFFAHFSYFLLEKRKNVQKQQFFQSYKNHRSSPILKIFSYAVGSKFVKFAWITSRFELFQGVKRCCQWLDEWIWAFTVQKSVKRKCCGKKYMKLTFRMKMLKQKNAKNKSEKEKQITFLYLWF